MQEYIQIGKIVATTGLTGKLIVKHGLGKRSDLKIKAIFIETAQSEFLPYFIQSVKSKSADETVIQIEGIERPESAKPLIQKPVWVSESDFRSLVSRNAPLAMLHYQLFDGELPIGKIEEVIEQPHQILVVIKVNGKDVLIPLHDQTLRKIDHEKAAVYAELPDGLLDIYQ